jgi:hypothetical protein
MTFLSTLSKFSFLIDTTFWSRIGFLISYIATFLIALEVFRLIYTDVNKREVEKFLENYSKQRNSSSSPVRRRHDLATKTEDEEKISVNIEDLQEPKRAESMISVNIDALERSVSPPRTRAAATPSSEEKTERRKRATSSASRTHAERTSSPTPIVRKLRKRSDTLTSTGSSESKRVSRRHRESSPASEAASSRHGSPRPRSWEDKEKRVGLGLGKLMRGKV